jgi:predicted esterase
MNIVGLKGFSRFGVINQYFTEGYFPDKANWNTSERDVDYVMDGYTDYIIPRPRTQSINYIAICYSDGGCVGHQLPAYDPNCVGVIAHSATFPERQMRRLNSTKCPILLLHNSGDLTRYMPSWHGRAPEAFEFYINAGNEVELHELPSKSWHGHDFDNAFGIMTSWALRNFDYKLPIK